MKYPEIGSVATQILEGKRSDPITVMLMEASWRIPGSSKTHLQD